MAAIFRDQHLLVVLDLDVRIVSSFFKLVRLMMDGTISFRQSLSIWTTVPCFVLASTYWVFDEICSRCLKKGLLLRWAESR